MCLPDAGRAQPAGGQMGHPLLHADLVEPSELRLPEAGQHMRPQQALVGGSRPWLEVRQRRKPASGPVLEAQPAQSRISPLPSQLVGLGDRQVLLGVALPAEVLRSLPPRWVTVPSLPAIRRSPYAAHFFPLHGSALRAPSSATGLDRAFGLAPATISLPSSVPLGYDIKLLGDPLLDVAPSVAEVFTYPEAGWTLSAVAPAVESCHRHVEVVGELLNGEQRVGWFHRVMLGPDPFSSIAFRCHLACQPLETMPERV